MQKIERLISIVMLLLQRERVSATELSRLFGVTKRTIQRDMDTLTYANIPVYAMHGREGGYGLMGEYKFDKRLLTHRDIEHIVVALDGFGQLSSNEGVQQTIGKIRGMSHIDLTPTLFMTFSDRVGQSGLTDELSILMDAIKNHWLIEFDYVDQKGAISRRTVEPYHLKLHEMKWYVAGYSVEREDHRTFKVTRMTDLKIKGSFTPRPQPSEGNGMEQPPLTSMMVKAEIDISVRDQFIERFGKQSVVHARGRTYEVTMELPENHFAYQFLAGFGNKVRIVEPQRYVEQFKEFLEEALRMYQ